MAAAIEFHNLEVRIPQRRALLDGISLVLDEGSVTAILGRSGSGKTTLLRSVNRMVEATAGAVLVNGRDVSQADLIALRRGMGYVIQDAGLFPHWTVGANVGLVPRLDEWPAEKVAGLRPSAAHSAFKNRFSTHPLRLPYILIGC